MDYRELIQKNRDGVKYSFARYGDGEWQCLLKKRPGKSNCDGHSYFPDLGERLLEILNSNPRYHLGLQRLAYRMYKDEINTITEHGGLSWTSADILHRASMRGELNDFFESLHERRVAIVCAEHLNEFAETNGWHVINVPSKNCWLSYSDTFNSIMQLINKYDTILYCASMMSNVLIDDFCNLFTQIDCGSVFDPYAGVNSRKYMKDLKI